MNQKHTNVPLNIELEFYNGPHAANVRVQLTETVPPYRQLTTIVPHSFLIAAGKDAEHEQFANER